MYSFTNTCIVSFLGHLQFKVLFRVHTRIRGDSQNTQDVIVNKQDLGQGPGSSLSTQDPTLSVALS